MALLNHAEHWALVTSEESDNVILEFEHRSSYTYPHLAIERSMVAIIAWANYFLRQPIDVQCARFTFAKPNHSQNYQTVFGNRLEFNVAVNQIVLSKPEFYQPLDNANPYLRDVLKARAQNVNLTINALESTVANVQMLLLENLAIFSSIENAISQLHMSRATL